MQFLYWLEDLRFPAGDTVFQWLTYLGQEIPILVILCILFWCVNKRLAYRIGLSFFFSGLLLQDAKLFFRIERPWVLDPNFTPVESAVPAATGYSFPSGHTQSAGALFFTLASGVKRKGLRVIFLLIPLLVAFSRMYLGVHTPKDVTAALLLSGGISFLFWKWDKRRPENGEGIRKADGYLSVLLSVLALAAAAYGIFLLRQGTVTEKMAMDCCKVAGGGLGLAAGWYLENRYIRFSVEGSAAAKSVRVVLGLLLLAALKLALGQILGNGLFGAVAENVLLVIWLICGYPLLLKCAARKKGQFKSDPE